MGAPDAGRHVPSAVVGRARSAYACPAPHPSGHPRAVQGNRTSPPGAGTLHSRAEDVGSNSSFTPRSNGWGNRTSFWARECRRNPLTQHQQSPIAQEISLLPGPIAHRKPRRPKEDARCSPLSGVNASLRPAKRNGKRQRRLAPATC
jgi:hypothetical protein